MKQTVLFASLVGVMLFGTVSPALARGEAEPGDDRGGLVKDVTDTLEDTVDDTISTVEDSVRISADSKPVEQLRQQQERIRDNRDRMKEVIAEKQEARREFLKGIKLARCENREARINRLLDTGAVIMDKQLSVIQRIEEGIKKFYVDKALSSEEYASAVAVAEEKEADAIAGIDLVKDMTFECDEADATKPSSDVKEMVSVRKQSLSEYRNAVKELLLVVKKALNAESEAES
jgi:hypothetical protein